MTHTTHRAASGLVVPAVLVSVTALLLLPVADASAQGRRPTRVDANLAERLRAGDTTDSSVIFIAPPARVKAIAARHGLRIKELLHSGAVFDVPAGRLAQLAEDPDVEALSSNYALRADMDVTNEAIGADQVWSDGWIEGVQGVTGEGVVVAVLDTGVAHVPELRGRIVASVNFTGSGTAQVSELSAVASLNTKGGAGKSQGSAGDRNGHGTHVAGIIAAAGVNKHDDTRGVAWAAQILDLKVLDDHGNGYAADVVKAIDYAVANKDRYKIRVLNMSFGGPVLQPYAYDPVNQAVERAHHAGIVVVASAGNGGKKDVHGREVPCDVKVPGNSPYAITVGAINTKGTARRSDDVPTTYSCGGRDAVRPSGEAGPLGARQQDCRPAGAGIGARQGTSRTGGGHRRRQAAAGVRNEPGGRRRVWSCGPRRCIPTLRAA